MSTRPIHPFLLAPLPFLMMLYANLSQVSTFAGMRLVILTVAITAIVYWLIRIPVRNPAAAGLIVTGLLVIWYTAPLWGNKSGMICLPMATLAVISRKRSAWFVGVMTFLLNAISIGMMAFILSAISITGLPRDIHLPHHNTDAHSAGPDVYFILIDSYGSHSLLEERFNYDNSAFLASLGQMGFETGECVSPWDLTEDSLTALLNGDRALTYDYQKIQHSKLRQALEQRGYSMWSFSTGWLWTEIMDGERYYQPAYGPMNEFEAFTLYLTPLKYIIDLDMARGNMMRLRAATLLNHLPDAAEDLDSQFVFAHIVQPHPPFVYNADGSPRNPKELTNPAWTYGDTADPEYLPADYADGYTDQLSYLTAALPPVLQQIIETAPDAQIILTGDHGPWYPANDTEAHAVLCATRNLTALDAVDAVNEIIK